ILVASLCFPGPQRSFIFLHWVVWPLGANFSVPEQFGYSPGAARQVDLWTESSLRLGAWHVLPASVYRQQVETANHTDSSRDALYDAALATHETVLYLHGNAATRGHYRRVDVCKLTPHMQRIATDMDANVFVVDYRGFADSGKCHLLYGTPSEAGLVEDAELSWQWLLDHGAPPANITILGKVGHAADIRARCTTDTSASLGVSPKLLILKAPFSSIPELVLEYRILKVLPLFRPLSLLPNS
ncbi:hypothetical protein SYNPS1DRAFT_4453, partial [Syncephalis pseudoplumigaleata]